MSVTDSERRALLAAVDRFGDLLFESRYSGAPGTDSLTEFWKVIGKGYVFFRHTDDVDPSHFRLLTQTLDEIHKTLAEVLTPRGQRGRKAESETTAPLIAAIDQLGDLLIEASCENAPLPDATLDGIWMVIGTSYIATRHPGEEPFPLPGMLAGVDRAHANLTRAIQRHRQRHQRSSA
ncbi:hypothetical protein ATY41_04875 [Leifsonia xyli subsp. xyli]|uniref:Uncharacterized protein n=2 Tax=Leifsonia xyli subsp. xyli TaxID=59736 RepID=Q6ACK1_LEIXX|nr:hypothetical protein [Leifsonia xyli]AAT89892.1 hypothetical protein Lxx22090 [Leifsonia xyli subsp. xyli str. CTCB07]ODA89611.1 hypothetical protein ATY41_04875 [Leifsonia xyli subsp. xyli]